MTSNRMWSGALYLCGPSSQNLESQSLPWEKYRLTGATPNSQSHGKSWENQELSQTRREHAERMTKCNAASWLGASLEQEEPSVEKLGTFEQNMDFS